MGHDMPEYNNKNITYGKDNIMKKTKFISICLALILVLSGFSACANPHKTSSPGAIPDPADQITKEETKKPDPVDLSVLSKTELDRITDELLAVLKTSDNTDRIFVSISFVTTEEEKNIDAVINKKMAKKEERSAEIEAELRILQNEYTILSKNADPNSKTKITEISQKISTLESELETYSMEYTELRVQMLENINKPIITDFSKRHSIDLSSAYHISYTVSDIFGIDLTASKIIELSKDNTVDYIDHLVPPEYTEWDEETTPITVTKNVFGYEYSISIDKNKYDLDDTIIAMVTLKNNNDEAIGIYSSDGGNYLDDIKFNNSTAYWKIYGVGEYIKVDLIVPGETLTYTQNITPGHPYDLRRPPAKMSEEWKITAKALIFPDPSEDFYNQYSKDTKEEIQIEIIVPH